MPDRAQNSLHLELKGVIIAGEGFTWQIMWRVVCVRGMGRGRAGAALLPTFSYSLLWLTGMI